MRHAPPVLLHPEDSASRPACTRHGCLASRSHRRYQLHRITAALFWHRIRTPERLRQAPSLRVSLFLSVLYPSHPPNNDSCPNISLSGGLTPCRAKRLAPLSAVFMLLHLLSCVSIHLAASRRPCASVRGM